MSHPAPAYYSQQQLDLRYAVYEADGSIARSADGLLLRDIETAGEADDYVLDLTAAAQADDAAQDDFDAEQVAEAA